MCKNFITSIASIAILLLLSCNNSSNKSLITVNRTANDSVHVVHYENEYYSIEHPSDWAVSEDISDKAEGYKNYKGNDKITLNKHLVNFFNDYGLIFNIVMSNLHFDIPVEDYADLSIVSKGLGDGGEFQDSINTWLENEPLHYIKLLSRDSVKLSNQKAIRLIFAAADDQNNLFLHNQFVIKNNKNDVFYINYTWQDGDEYAKKLGNLISSTFTLKK